MAGKSLVELKDAYRIQKSVTQSQQSRNVSRISFAPGTTFHNRSGLRSRKSARSLAPTFNIRPVTLGEKMSRTRFQLPRATLPSFHYLTNSQEDRRSTCCFEDVVKAYQCHVPRSLPGNKPEIASSSTAVVSGQNELRLSADKTFRRLGTLNTEMEYSRPQSTRVSVYYPLACHVPTSVRTANNRDTTIQRSQSSSFGAQIEDVIERKYGEAVTIVTNNAQVPVSKPWHEGKYFLSPFYRPVNPVGNLHDKRALLATYKERGESEQTVISRPMSKLKHFELREFSNC